MKKATQKEYIKEYMRLTNQTKADARYNLELHKEIMESLIENHGGLKLEGFGTFEIRERKSRIVKSGLTDEKHKLPTTKHVHFKTSRMFRIKLNPYLTEGNEKTYED